MDTQMMMDLEKLQELVTAQFPPNGIRHFQTWADAVRQGRVYSSSQFQGTQLLPVQYPVRSLRGSVPARLAVETSAKNVRMTMGLPSEIVDAIADFILRHHIVVPV